MFKLKKGQSAASIQSDLEILQRVLTDLRESRPKMLLEDDDAMMVKYDQTIAAKEREIERTEAKLEAAKKIEEEEAIAKKRKADEAEADKGWVAQKRGIAIYAEYEKHAKAIVELVTELQGIHEVIDKTRPASERIGKGRIPYPYLQLSTFKPAKQGVIKHVEREIPKQDRYGNFVGHQAITDRVVVGGREATGGTPPDLTKTKDLVLVSAYNQDNKIYP